MRNGNTILMEWGGKHNRFIDILKGVCIIFVIVTHFWWDDSERLKYLFPFWIDMAVPIFMIISGYVYAFSYQKNKINKIGDAYLFKNFANKIVRYTVPFLITFFIQELVLILKGDLSLRSIFEIVKTFLVGGVGPGSYYYPVMIQFVFIYPIIYFIVKKYEFKGVIICGFLNAVYELLQRAYGMNEECYRLIMLRYILVIAIGCYIARNKININKRIMVSSFIIGFIFILAFCYLGYEPIIIVYWTRTSFMACLYIIPLVVIMIRKCNKMHFVPLEMLGKASYHIFLTQMVYFYFANGIIGRIIPNTTLHLLVNLIVCLSVGVLFYLIETPITKYINRKVYSFIK